MADSSVLEHRNFSNIDISRRSVATCLNYGGIFNNDFITNLLMSLSVKEFWQSVSIWWSYGQDYSGSLFDKHKTVVLQKKHETARFAGRIGTQACWSNEAVSMQITWLADQLRSRVMTSLCGDRSWSCHDDLSTSLMTRVMSCQPSVNWRTVIAGTCAQNCSM